MLYALSNNIGAAPEYMYPLFVYRINGFYQFIGQEYGPSVAVVLLILLFLTLFSRFLQIACF